MKIITILFLAACLTCFAQTDVNKIKVIPSPTGSAVGEIDFQNKANTFHTGLAGADTIPANHVFRLPPADTGGGGCWKTDGSYNTSIGSCSGAANSINVSPTNPLILFAHFRADDQSLYLDYSRDYLNYRSVSKQPLLVQPYVRDVSVMYSAATSTFWFISSPATLSTIACQAQFWSSTDLIHYSSPQLVDISAAVGGGANCSIFAPEWNTTSTIGFWSGTGDGTYRGAWFTTFNPDTDGTTPTANTHVSINLTSYETAHGSVSIWDLFPYYDGTYYYLQYVDNSNRIDGRQTQFIGYAKSTTLLSPYYQQTPVNTDFFQFNAQAEGSSVVPLADSVTRYGKAGCVRTYADTWLVTQDPGSPTIITGNQVWLEDGNRDYHWVYQDTCPLTIGGDPFGELQKNPIVANVNGTNVAWVSGPSFSGLYTGQVIPIFNGQTTVNYTIASIQSPGNLTLTSGVLINGVIQGIQNVIINATGFLTPQPVNIAGAEHGTPLLITDNAVAAKVYQAEDYFHNDNFLQSGLVVGGQMGNQSTRDTRTFNSPGAFGNGGGNLGYKRFTITAQSNFAAYGLSYDEPATLAAGGPDDNATLGPASFAYWASCGVNTYSCPQPPIGEASWLFRYNGINTMIQLDHSSGDYGESSIGFSNGLIQYASPATSIPPITSSSVGNRSLWKMGTNNQAFGPIFGFGNVSNNWFYVFNAGLGSHGNTNIVANPGFEGTGTGSLASWSASGFASVGSGCGKLCVHKGLYSAALGSGGTIGQTVTGVANTVYVVTAWVLVSNGASTGVIMNVGPGAIQNCNNSGAGCLPNFSWYQIGAQYTTGASGLMSINITRPFGSGTAYIDDVEAFPRDQIHGGPQGAFALGISPSSGEVRANYGFTIGNGDISDLAQYPSINLDSPVSGILNVGDGLFGNHNATIKSAALVLGNQNGVDFGTGVINEFAILQDNTKGVQTELLHHGADDNVYLDNYGDATGLPCLLAFPGETQGTGGHCAPMMGGGNIFIRPSPGAWIFSQGYSELAGGSKFEEVGNYNYGQSVLIEQLNGAFTDGPHVTFAKATAGVGTVVWNMGIDHDTNIRTFSISEGPLSTSFGINRLTIAPGGIVQLHDGMFIGSSILFGAVVSTQFSTNNGTLSSTANTDVSLGNFGLITNNNSSLGIHARRVATGSGWDSAAIQLGMDVDNVNSVGPGTYGAGFNSANGVWIGINGIGIGKVATSGNNLDVSGLGHADRWDADTRVSSGATSGHGVFSVNGTDGATALGGLTCTPISIPLTLSISVTCSTGTCSGTGTGHVTACNHLDSNRFLGGIYIGP